MDRRITISEFSYVVIDAWKARDVNVTEAQPWHYNASYKYSERSEPGRPYSSGTAKIDAPSIDLLAAYLHNDKLLMEEVRESNLKLTSSATPSIAHGIQIDKLDANELVNLSGKLYKLDLEQMAFVLQRSTPGK